MSDSLLTKLKQRNVFKVGTAYLLLAWVVIQVTDSAVPALNLPGWVNSFVFFIGAIGFPFALFFAWAFEVTPEGVKKTADDAASSYGVIALTLGIVAVSGWYYFGEQNDKVANTPKTIETVAPSLPIANDKSIAVLPFVDMSAAGDQEYLGDGITEEVLNVLVRSQELRVVGRTSSFAFKGLNQDLREIGEALGVAYILEGSVRKSGNRVRVTAQLVKASDGFHLWSHTYDKTIDDIFALQDDIASAISAALETSLDFTSEQLAASRTENIVANEFYLQGLSALKSRGDNVAYSVVLFRAATELDPDFSAAWSALAYGYMQLWGRRSVRTDAFTDYREDVIKDAIENSLRLNPNDATAHHMKANIYRSNKEWNAAEAEYKLALGFAPQSAAIYEDYSEFLQFTGRLKDAVKTGYKTYELDPLTSLYIAQYAEAAVDIGQYDLAKAYFQLAFQQGRSAYGLMLLYAIEEQYEEMLELLNDSTGIFDEWRDYFQQLVAFARGDTATAPEIKDRIYLRLLRAIVLKNMDRHDEALSYIFKTDSGRVLLMKFFSDFWHTEEFRQYVLESGLITYWRTSNTWGDMCRPLGDDDFECGVFTGD